MKKMYRILFAVAAAATAFIGCVREPEMLPAAKEHAIHFVAESIETRTAFGEPTGNNYPTLWTENDNKVKVMLHLKKEQDVSVIPSADGKKATFSAAFPDTTIGYKFFAVSPSTAIFGKDESVSGEIKYRIGLNVPNTQTPTAKSVDEVAQILVAQTDLMQIVPETVSFQFHHWTAYGKFSLTNLALNGASIEAVDLTAEEKWAGRWYYFFSDETSAVNSGSSTISINTTSSSDIWFACAPVDMSGKKLTVTVKTDKGTLTKEFTMPANRKFESGQVARFTLNMNGATLKESAVYQLITNPSGLTVDSKVIIAAAASDYAISTTQNTNNRAATGVTKTDDKIIDPSNAVEVFTVESGTTEGTYSFKTSAGYLYAASSSTSGSLKTKSTKDAKGSWTITFGTKTVMKAGLTGDNPRNILQFNYNNGTPLFNCYNSSASSRDSVAIYKLISGEAPVEKKDPALRIENLTLTVEVGESKEIGIESVAEGYDGTITYTSSDTDIATVDDEGMVMGVKPGSCTVTVTAPETATFNSGTKTCTVTVKDNAAKTLPYEEPLTSTLGDFTIEDKTLPEGLSYVWGNKPSGYAKASAYISSTSTNYKAESWLVSPQIDLTSQSQAYLAFSYALNFGVPASYDDQFYLMINNGTSWSKVSVPNLPEAGSWTFYDVVIDLASYCGKTIQFAFVYNSKGVDSAPTLEVDHVRVATDVKGHIKMMSTMSLMTGSEPKSLEATVNSGAIITYTSNNTAVATVDATGRVTAVAAGTATITATAPATGYYTEASAACEVTVTQSGSTGVSFVEMDPDNVIEGNYVIAGTSGTKTYVMKNAIQSKYYTAASEFDLTAGTEPSAEHIFAIAQSGSGYTIKGNDGTYLYIAVSGTHYNLLPKGTTAYIWTFAAGTSGGILATGGNSNGNAISFDASHSDFATSTSPVCPKFYRIVK